jgi:hypothetical protein
MLFSNHMHNILQGVFVNSNRLRIKTVNPQHLALRILYLYDVNCILLGVDTGIGGSQWHQFVKKGRLLVLDERVTDTLVSQRLQVALIRARGSAGQRVTVHPAVLLLHSVSRAGLYGVTLTSLRYLTSC